MGVKGYREETGLLYFIVMMIVSAAYFLFFHATVQGVGVLILAWSAITGLRALWFFHLIRVLGFDEEADNKTQLPEQILRKMHSYKDRENGFHALRAINGWAYFPVALIGIYLLWGAYLSFTMPDIAALKNVRESIITFLQAGGITHIPFFQIALHNVLLHAALVMMVCFAFWQSMSFAFLPQYRIVVLGAGSGLFCFSLFWNAGFSHVVVDLPVGLFQLWAGYGAGRFDILQSMGEIPSSPLSSFMVRLATMGWIGVGLLYGAGFYMVATLFRGLFVVGVQRRYAAGGILVLAVMALCDLFIERSVIQMPLWMSGWSVLAVCRAGINNGGRKTHRLHTR